MAFPSNLSDASGHRISPEDGVNLPPNHLRGEPTPNIRSGTGPDMPDGSLKLAPNDGSGRGVWRHCVNRL